MFGGGRGWGRGVGGDEKLRGCEDELKAAADRRAKNAFIGERERGRLLWATSIVEGNKLSRDTAYVKRIHGGEHLVHVIGGSVVFTDRCAELAPLRRAGTMEAYNFRARESFARTCDGAGVEADRLANKSMRGLLY